MAINCIHSIELTTLNGEVFSVTSDDFQNFYVANINENGEEINYIKKNGTLQANFMIIKLLHDESYSEILKRLYECKDITKIELLFTNGNNQKIDLSTKRVMYNGSMFNKYENTYMINNDLCILVSDKKIKYCENLFI